MEEEEEEEEQEEEEEERGGRAGRDTLCILHVYRFSNLQEKATNGLWRKRRRRRRRR